jgi:hypothetical protein
MFKESLFYTQVIQQSQTIPNYRNVRTLNRQEKMHFLYSRNAPDCLVTLSKINGYCEKKMVNNHPLKLFISVTIKGKAFFIYCSAERELLFSQSTDAP